MNLKALRCAGTDLPKVNITDTTVSQVVWEGVSLGAGLWQVHPLNKCCAALLTSHDLLAFTFHFQPYLSCDDGAAAVHILFASISFSQHCSAMPLLWQYIVTGIDVMATAARFLYPRECSCPYASVSLARSL